MHSLLQQRAEQRVERVVRLGEMDAGTPGAQVLEARPSLGLREQRAADGRVLPRLLRLHLGEPLPGLPLAAGEEVARHPEGAVADEAVADVVARVEDVDGDVAGLGVRDAGPEQLPQLVDGGVDVDVVVVLLHRLTLSLRLTATSGGAAGAARRKRGRPVGSPARGLGADEGCVRRAPLRA